MGFFSRYTYHSLLNCSVRLAHAKLDSGSLARLLKAAAKVGCYNYASPFHSRSRVVRDLTALYGNDKLVRAGMATVESRIKVASDIIALRLQRKISILSLIHI